MYTLGYYSRFHALSYTQALREFCITSKGLRVSVNLSHFDYEYVTMYNKLALHFYAPYDPKVNFTTNLIIENEV